MNNSTKTSQKTPQIGEVYLVEFEGGYNEQRGLRPAMIFQNNVGNNYSPNVIVLPLTTSIKKMNMPTHVFLEADKNNLRYDSIVLCENPYCISKLKLGKYLTKISEEKIKDIARANLLSSSIISFLSMSEVADVWKDAVVLNSAARRCA